MLDIVGVHCGAVADDWLAASEWSSQDMAPPGLAAMIRKRVALERDDGAQEFLVELD